MAVITKGSKDVQEQSEVCAAGRNKYAPLTCHHFLQLALNIVKFC